MTVSACSCRSCGAPLTQTFCDLGMSPAANAYLDADQLGRMEPFYPLHAYVCGKCFLVQLEEFQTPGEIFSEYAYLSSYSDTWLAHARSYADLVTERFKLTRSSRVVEIASNDGYLLQYFKARGIPVLGIEPAANAARIAEKDRGVPTIVKFFGTATASELVHQGLSADLMAANNVLAHVPQLNDFVAGFKIMLKPHGVATLEFPHLLHLIEQNQFDTIYHEHFSYFSCLSIAPVFERHGLTVFDVDEIPTHGGSLRIYVRHAENADLPISSRVQTLIAKERAGRLDTLAAYGAFSERVREVKRGLLAFLIEARRSGRSVAAYGAAAKGNTLLNYCGIRTDFIDYVVDRSPRKQGRYLPGTHIPIAAPDRIRETKPDYLLILPWNIQAEVIEQNAFIREWGARFVVAVPQLTIIS